jgi:hypothetical protein
MRRAQTFLAAVSLLILGGCTALDGPPEKLAHPACAPHRTELDPAIEPGRPLSRHQPPAPRDGPPSGYACVHVTITTDGRVVDPEVRATNHPGFAASFVEVLSQWRYEPSLRDGEPVELRTLLSASYVRRAQ